MRGTAWAAMVAGTLALSACGSSSPTESTAATEASPLWEFLGANTDQDEVRSQNRLQQDLIASCMKVQGFEYTPIDDTQTPTDGIQAEPAAPFGSRAYAEKYGYGISEQQDLTAGQAPVETTNPNLARVDQMSAAEQEAYWLALGGDGSLQENLATTDPSRAPAEPTVANAGCQGVAMFKVLGARAFGGLVADPHEDLWADLQRRRDAIGSDPRMVAKATAWRECLDNKGFAGLSDKPRQDFWNEWEELHGATVTPDDGGWLSSGGFLEPTPEEVTEFKKREIAAAVADFDCRDGMDALGQELVIAMEKTFVEDHKTELEQMRNEMNGG